MRKLTACIIALLLLNAALAETINPYDAYLHAKETPNRAEKYLILCDAAQTVLDGIAQQKFNTDDFQTAAFLLFGAYPPTVYDGEWSDAAQKCIALYFVGENAGPINITYARCFALTSGGGRAVCALAQWYTLDGAAAELGLSVEAAEAILAAIEEYGIVVDWDAIREVRSFAEELTRVQSQLAELDLLGEAEITGINGKATRAALTAFQKRVNELRGAGALDETGTGDAMTLALLAYYAGHIDEWFGAEADPAPAAALPDGGAERGTKENPLPIGDPYSFTLQLRADGTPRTSGADERATSDLPVTLTLSRFLTPDYYEQKYRNRFQLKGDEAGAELAITLGTCAGLSAVSMQDVIFIAFENEAGEVDKGYKFTDAEIGGESISVLATGDSGTIYKRVKYSAAENLAYMTLTYFVDAQPVTVYFSLGSPQP